MLSNKVYWSKWDDYHGPVSRRGKRKGVGNLELSRMSAGNNAMIFLTGLSIGSW